MTDADQPVFEIEYEIPAHRPESITTHRSESITTHRHRCGRESSRYRNL